MLRDLFPKRHTRYERCLFAEDLDAFASWLHERGYSCHSARGHVFRLKQTLARIDGVSSGATFTSDELEQAFAGNGDPVLYRATQRVFQRFLKPLGRMIETEAEDRFSVLRRDYRLFLEEMRGLAAATIQQHEGTVTELLSSVTDLDRLSSATVEQYLLAKSKLVRKQTLQHIVAHLRAFLRYCYDHNVIGQRLDAIDTPRTYRDELPPRALDWKLVQRLLASVDRRDRTGWRDYAILHLMAHYGLRPSEIVTLKLSAIDWTAQTLAVEQRKTRSALVLPLGDRTVHILRKYLHRGRPPSEHPELFLRARSPAGPLRHYAVLNVFEKRARLSGLPLAGSSSYCLRHAFAMRLLKRGVGVKAIGDLLGHHSLEATCVYLRVDTDMLREVALPVPVLARV
jgi:site-specific recombinase XerD